MLIFNICFKTSREVKQFSCLLLEDINTISYMCSPHLPIYISPDMLTIANAIVVRKLILLLCEKLTK